jgi:hypothetical protein
VYIGSHPPIYAVKWLIVGEAKVAPGKAPNLITANDLRGDNGP